MVRGVGGVREREREIARGRQRDGERGTLLGTQNTAGRRKYIGRKGEYTHVRADVLG